MFIYFYFLKVSFNIEYMQWRYYHTGSTATEYMYKYVQM